MTTTLRTLLLAVALFPGCRPGAKTAEAPAAAATSASASARHPAWSRSATIYEINVRQYTPEGTLAALRRHLPRLDSLGADILWLMPVQPIGVKNRKGPLGSYYSIANYTAVNPEFGTEGDFKALVDDAHRLGMRVILDWVPNHSSHDHPWTVQHRDYYVLRPDGSISNARDNEGRETDWTDVAELNYDNPALRRAMIAEMRWWVDSMGVDGFRCDVAGGVPYDFWAQAHRELKGARPDLFMLAESEDPRLHEWFDMTYGWELHHLLNEVAQGKKGSAALDEYFAKDRRRFPADAYRMYFTSNHDENSWQGTEFERMGENHRPAFVLAATAQNGMPLLYTGQEAGMTKRLRFFEKDTVDWGGGASLAAFYRAMFALKHGQPALANGAAGGPQATLRTVGGERVYAYTRTRGSNTVLVALNFAATPARVSYEGLAAGGYTDWFDRSRVTLASSGTLEVPANGYRVLVRD
jgi:alpha-amylase